MSVYMHMRGERGRVGKRERDTHTHTHTRMITHYHGDTHTKTLRGPTTGDLSDGVAPVERRENHTLCAVVPTILFLHGENGGSDVGPIRIADHNAQKTQANHHEAHAFVPAPLFVNLFLGLSERERVCV
jgi:hypothetical protein